jgi:hypothetical protein
VSGLRSKGDLVLALQAGGGRTSRKNKQMVFPSNESQSYSRGSLHQCVTKDLARCCSGNRGPTLGSGPYVCRALIPRIALFSVLTPLPYTKYIVTKAFSVFFCLESGPNMYQLTWCNGDKIQHQKIVWKSSLLDKR